MIDLILEQHSVPFRDDVTLAMANTSDPRLPYSELHFNIHYLPPEHRFANNTRGGLGRFGAAISRSWTAESKKILEVQAKLDEYHSMRKVGLNLLDVCARSRRDRLAPISSIRLCGHNHDEKEFAKLQHDHIEWANNLETWESSEKHMFGQISRCFRVTLTGTSENTAPRIRELRRPHCETLVIY